MHVMSTYWLTVWANEWRYAMGCPICIVLHTRWHQCDYGTTCHQGRDTWCCDDLPTVTRAKYQGISTDIKLSQICIGPQYAQPNARGSWYYKIVSSIFSLLTQSIMHPVTFLFNILIQSLHVLHQHCDHLAVHLRQGNNGDCKIY